MGLGCGRPPPRLPFADHPLLPVQPPHSLSPARHVPPAEKHLLRSPFWSCCTCAQKASLPSLHLPPLSLAHSLCREPSPRPRSLAPGEPTCICAHVTLHHLHFRTCLCLSPCWGFFTGRHHGNAVSGFVSRPVFHSRSPTCINLNRVCLILLYRFPLAKHCDNYPIGFYN